MRAARNRAYALAAAAIREEMAELDSFGVQFGREVLDELNVIATALERAAAAMEASTTSTPPPEAPPA